jgi:hypothetical protein
MPAGHGDDIETKKEAASRQASLGNANGFAVLIASLLWSIKEVFGHARYIHPRGDG